MKKSVLFLFSILFITMFISCEKIYYPNDIDDLMKIRELIVDMDCEKGCIMKWQNSSAYDNSSGGGIMYCKDIEEAGGIEVFANELIQSGVISSAKYDRSKKSVIIKAESKFQTYFRQDYYTVIWYWVTTKSTITFYTKNKH